MQLSEEAALRSSLGGQDVAATWEHCTKLRGAGWGMGHPQNKIGQPEWEMSSRIHECPFGNACAGSSGKVLKCYHLSLICWWGFFFVKSMKNIIKATIFTSQRVLLISRSYRLCKKSQCFEFHPSSLYCVSSCGTPPKVDVPLGALCAGGVLTNP